MIKSKRVSRFNGFVKKTVKTVSYSASCPMVTSLKRGVNETLNSRSLLERCVPAKDLQRLIDR